MPAIVRRPGELHEAVSIDAASARALERETARTGVDRDVLASLALELSASIRDLGEDRVRRLVLPAAKPGRRALSAAESDYLRALTLRRGARSSRPMRGPATVAAPVRLLARLREARFSEAFSPARVDAAIAWEIVAVLEGRTLSESILLAASG